MRIVATSQHVHLLITSWPHRVTFQTATRHRKVAGPEFYTASSMLLVHVGCFVPAMAELLVAVRNGPSVAVRSWRTSTKKVRLQFSTLEWRGIGFDSTDRSDMLSQTECIHNVDNTCPARVTTGDWSGKRPILDWRLDIFPLILDSNTPTKYGTLKDSSVDLQVEKVNCTFSFVRWPRTIKWIPRYCPDTALNEASTFHLQTLIAILRSHVKKPQFVSRRKLLPLAWATRLVRHWHAVYSTLFRTRAWADSIV